MIDKSYAYKILKEQTEGLFNFVILVSTAVPNLEKTIRYINDTKEGFSAYTKKGEQEENSTLNFTLSKPIYFENADIVRVQRILDFKREIKKSGNNNPTIEAEKWGHRVIFENNLSKYILLSSFSFFESYIQNIVKEAIDFHGGEKKIDEVIRRNITNYSVTINQRAKKLQEPFDKGRLSKYKNITEELDKSNFVFPAQIFALQGIKRLSIITKENGFKASRIPELLNDLLFDVSKLWKNGKSIENNLDEIRDLRNDIAHGKQSKTLNLRLKDVLTYNNFLKKVAIEIDDYFIKNLFVIDLTLQK